MTAAKADLVVPLDIIVPIVELLTDRRDLNRCALVSRAFNEAATPRLYRTLDSRIRSTRDAIRERIAHPSKTILQKPWYAKYVRHVSETASVGRYEPGLLPDCQAVLRMCTNLRGFTWMDDGTESLSTPSAASAHDSTLLAYLDIIEPLGVSELTIRTSSGISTAVWNRLTRIGGLHKVGIWCLHGQPRYLHGWSERLGPSLTHLELGVSCLSRQHPQCVPATVLVTVLTHLKHLKSLRLKGAPSNSIPELLAVLPALVTLDTEYHGPGISKLQSEPLASLRELTVRASSVDLLGPHQLWPWIRRLIPRPSLESFTLDTFSTLGEMSMPRYFLIGLAQTHRETMRGFMVDTVKITIEELELLCTQFPALESLSCSVVTSYTAEQYRDTIANAHNLRRLRLNAMLQPGSPRLKLLTPEIAKEWMLRDDSKLRHIAIGRDVFEGHWCLVTDEKSERHQEFVVERREKYDTWI